ncbi:histidine kinase [Pseudoxanthomonas sp. LH2527]|uniref:sensor histidine kinase n=1 Tax=Pseudoxanthomonas sp. LH2527 TaxID=2923249 RepID=UPI001F144CA4|nr:sensor histidine kinase [Pseudoxanthomonas sp. LH2527]MCH6482150.1 histidine kinase [Pseudoxanthomonas sp. LH2527]
MSKGLVFVLMVGLWIAIVCPSGHARSADRSIRQFHHTAWTAKDGAPPEIWAMDQGPDGFLWLGTGSGLHLFDGVHFEHFQPAPGQRLASIDITAVEVVATNEAWIGYSDGGISHLRDGRVTTFLEKDGVWPGMVVRLVKDRNGALWALSHGGLSRFEDGQWRKLGADWGIPSEMLIELFLARDGTFWLSTTRTIFFLRPGARKFEPTGVIAHHATFTHTPDGRIWVTDNLHGLRPLQDFPAGESRSLWTLKPATGANALAAANYAIDRHGAIWGTDRLRGGIFRFDPRQGPPPTQSLDASDVDVFQRKDGLTSDRSIPILTDREGNIWVGTNAGLNRFRTADILHDTAVPSATAFGYGIAAMPDATYITDGVSLFRAAPNEAARPFARLAESGPTVFFRSRDDALWYGNRRQLVRFRDNKHSRIPFPADVVEQNIRAMAEDGAGNLWVAFPTGTYRLTRDAWSGKLDFGLPPPSIAQSDPSGPVWFGFTDNRVSRHDANGMRVYDTREGLEVGGVEDIKIRDGVVWVGGEFGVARLDGGRFQTVGAGRVAPLFGISGIGWTAGGDFLFNGLLGVVRMKADEVRKAFADPSYSPVYRVYDQTDGMPGVAQQGSRSSSIETGEDGRIWVIGNNGVAVLAADDSDLNNVPPPVAIASVTAQGAVYSNALPLALPAGTSSLTITYTAVSLSVPERVRFRYKMENLHADWVDAGGHREVTYNNLGPGRYRFHVIAANEDNVWNADGATLEIEIPPTFLQSWKFKLLCALAMVGLLWLAYSRRLRVVAERIRMRMSERIEERERISRELHDTLLQSVQAMTLHFQAAVHELPKDLPARAKLEDVLDRADAVIAEGRNRVLDLRTARDCDIGRIIEAITAHVEFDPGVDIRVTTVGEPRALEPLVAEEVTRIASEAIFNIWRHANASRVEIDISHGAHFCLRIADNGVGLTPEVADRGQKEGHFGLAGMRERARNLRGSFHVRVLSGGGTEVRLMLPGSIAYRAATHHTDSW